MKDLRYEHCTCPVCGYVGQFMDFNGYDHQWRCKDWNTIKVHESRVAQWRELERNNS
jgi:hypothetical protein